MKSILVFFVLSVVLFNTIYAEPEDSSESSESNTEASQSASQGSSASSQPQPQPQQKPPPPPANQQQPPPPPANQQQQPAPQNGQWGPYYVVTENYEYSNQASEPGQNANQINFQVTPDGTQSVVYSGTFPPPPPPPQPQPQPQPFAVNGVPAPPVFPAQPAFFQQPAQQIQSQIASAGQHVPGPFNGVPSPVNFPQPPFQQAFSTPFFQRFRANFPKFSF